MTQRIRRWCGIGVTGMGLVVLTGCGGGGGGGDEALDNTPPPPPPPAAVISGVFKDANVGGLSFESGGEAGITGADGRFTCETGADVSFSIGSVALGSTECATLVTPSSLVASGALDDVETLNRVRFLLMLDRDGSPANGIEISEAVQEVAAFWVQPDFATADLNAELVSIISDAFSVDETMLDLPGADVALTHLTDTVECAYGGSFAGTMSGDLTGAIALTIGDAFQPTGPRAPSNVGWEGFDGVEEFIAGGGGGGSITYSARPVVDHSGPNLAGPISGQFETPDRITGTWEQPASNLSGTFSVDRLGDDLGRYRFTGWFGDSESRGVIALSLTDDGTVSGEAFDLVEGQTFDLTGSMTSDAMSLTATSGAETVTATATVGRDSSFVQASACRLN